MQAPQNALKLLLGNVVWTKIDDAGIRQREGEPIIKLIVPAGGAVAIGLGLVEGRRPRGYLQSAWLWEGASWCDENGALGLGLLSWTPEPPQPQLAVRVLA